MHRSPALTRSRHLTVVTLLAAAFVSADGPGEISMETSCNREIAEPTKVRTRLCYKRAPLALLTWHLYICCAHRAALYQSNNFV